MRSLVSTLVCCALIGCAAEPTVIAPDAVSPPDTVAIDRSLADRTMSDAAFDAAPDGTPDGTMDAGHDLAPREIGTDTAVDRSWDAFADADAVGVRCAVGLDSDGDGLSNDVECAMGTDPFLADGDMDGLSDGAEVRYPRACVASDRRAQRRPPVACTMDANCAMGERCLGLDPRRADTDGDGVVDGHEDPDGNGVIDPMRGETDPRLFDTDGDGRGDGMSGLAICRPDGLATVTLTALASAPVQLGFDPRWGTARRFMGTMGRSAIALDDGTAQVAALVAVVPASGDIRAEAMRIEAMVTAALGAGVTPVLVGRSLSTHEAHPAVTSTYRVARNTTAPALRDALLMPLVGASPTASMAYGMAGEFLVDVTTVRRTMGRAANINDVVVTVAPRALYDDDAMPTALRVGDLTNTTALAESDKGLGFHCQRVIAPGAPRVDFVWTVDVSVSMGPHQVAIGDTAQRFFQDLHAAGVDFRVAVLKAASTPFDFARPAPGLTWVSGSAPGGALELAYRVTVERYQNMPADRFWPYGNNGSFVVQLDEEPLAAGVLAFEQLMAGARMGAPEAQRVREGARLVAFFVADETGANDDNRFFSRDTRRWGSTYAARLAAATAFYRDRGILTFGMVNDQGSNCASNVVADMRKCLITGNGGAYIPMRNATPADVAAAMRRIVDAVAGASSPYRLERQPITSTLKVRVRGVDVPRSRRDGFDYDQASNTVVFRGSTYRPAMGDEVVISYRVWQPCPGLGASCSTAGECCAPQECVLGRCAPPCLRLGATCTSDGACCAPNACILGRCAPPTACRPAGESCRVDAECCAPSACAMGRCTPPPPCRPVGGSCTSPADCCSMTCTMGRCAPPPCRPTTGMCTSAADCCSGSCVGGFCAPG